MVFSRRPGRLIDEPSKSALCRILELFVSQGLTASPPNLPLRDYSPIDVLKIYLLQDLTIAYDNGVDIVRLEGVDFSNHWSQWIVHLAAR